jgi:hypothetical protein
VNATQVRQKNWSEIFLYLHFRAYCFIRFQSINYRVKNSETFWIKFSMDCFIFDNLKRLKHSLVIQKVYILLQDCKCKTFSHSWKESKKVKVKFWCSEQVLGRWSSKLIAYVWNKSYELERNEVFYKVFRQQTFSYLVLNAVHLILV